VVKNRPEQRSQSANSPGPALAVSHLSFSYPDQRNVLQDISLKVTTGEHAGLIGPNGAGKTTFFLAICGVLEPDEGVVRLFGERVNHGGFHPEVGMVFQDPDDQLFCPSVREDVAFGPRNLGLSQKAVKARVEEALSTTGTLTLADRAPHHLSGGEKRMVSIAGVLAMHPRLVIYDEPNASLDMRARRRLIRFLQRSEETFLVASHDLELILEVCERVILMDRGQIVTDGNPAELMRDVALMERHGLEKPHSLIPHTEPRHERQ
jgi:cobalt/nickel transport system ATP-binding protein